MICEICGSKKIELLYSYACPSVHDTTKQNNKKYVYKLYTPVEIFNMKNEGANYESISEYEIKEDAEERNKNEWANLMIVVPVLKKDHTKHPGIMVGYNNETQEFETQ